MSNALSPEAKYGKEAEFADPVLRCDSCIQIVYRHTIHKKGKCPHCGNRKFREIHQLSEHEMTVLKGSDIDPDFIAMFESVEEAQ